MSFLPKVSGENIPFAAVTRTNSGSGANFDRPSDFRLFIIVRVDGVTGMGCARSVTRSSLLPTRYTVAARGATW